MVYGQETWQTGPCHGQNAVEEPQEGFNDNDGHDKTRRKCHN